MTTKPLPAIAVAFAVLSGCSSSDTVATLTPVNAASPVSVALSPAASVGTGPAFVPQQNVLQQNVPVATTALAQPAVSTPVVSTPTVNAALASTRVDLAPVTGAPAPLLSPLSSAMSARGRELGLGLGGSPTHRLKGYFSINDDGAETRVVYIWDVIDGAGRRVHRIQGQEVINNTARGDAWAIVPPATMERIGRSTIDRFAQWRRTA